jgi:iron complex outermembrane receptor protein
VAQIDSSRWSITIRGFNSRFANKVQVLVDGRSLYSPSFGGVYWDANDTFLDDIERIEVTRGPGGATSPLNTVNGVINIITKHADQTQGVFFNGDAGMEHPQSTAMRVGGGSSADARWRMYGKYSSRDSNEDLSGRTTHDDWKQKRVGGRGDFTLGNGDDVRVVIDAYDGSLGQDNGPGISFSGLIPVAAAAVQSQPVRERMDGTAANVDWTHHTLTGGTLSLQGSLEHLTRDAPVAGEQRDGFELQLQHVLARSGRQQLQWGLFTRLNSDRIFDPSLLASSALERDIWSYSAYAQDQLYFADDRLLLTLGTKLERTDLGGTEFSPSIHAQFSPLSQLHLWSSISRGVRSPTRNEHDLDRYFLLGPPSSTGPALAIRINGNRGEVDESVIAYEAGLRINAQQLWSLDVTGFYNDYNHLVTTNFNDLICASNGQSIFVDPACGFVNPTVVVTGHTDNDSQGQTWGGEALLSWRALSNWRLVASYALLRGNLPPSIYFPPVLQTLASLARIGADDSPIPQSDFFTGSTLNLDSEHQYGLQSFFNINSRWDFDLALRHHSALPAGIAAYTDLGARLAWRPTRNTEVGLVGVNLLHDSHQEVVSNYAEILPTRIQRSVFAQLRWSF